MVNLASQSQTDTSDSIPSDSQSSSSGTPSLQDTSLSSAESTKLHDESTSDAPDSCPFDSDTETHENGSDVVSSVESSSSSIDSSSSTPQSTSSSDSSLSPIGEISQGEFESFLHLINRFLCEDAMLRCSAEIKMDKMNDGLRHNLLKKMYSQREISDEVLMLFTKKCVMEDGGKRQSPVLSALISLVRSHNENAIEIIKNILDSIVTSIADVAKVAHFKAITHMAMKCPFLLEPHLQPISALYLNTLDDINEKDPILTFLNKHSASCVHLAIVDKVTNRRDFPIEEPNSSDELGWEYDELEDDSRDVRWNSLGFDDEFPSTSYKFLTHDQWQMRYAGLVALTSCEGCLIRMSLYLTQTESELSCPISSSDSESESFSESTESELEDDLCEACRLIVDCLNDSHPRIRFAACVALEKYAFNLRYTHNYGENLLKAFSLLVNILITSNIDQSLSAAFHALDQLTDRHKKYIVSDHLDTVMPLLIQSFKDCYKRLQSERNHLSSGLDGILKFIIRVVECSKELIPKFYDELMPILLPILKEGAECILGLPSMLHYVSSLAKAVGKERFAADANEVMEFIAANLDSLYGDYILRDFRQLIPLMDNHFLQFIPTIMPLLINNATKFANSNDAKKVGNSPNFENKFSSIKLILIVASNFTDVFGPYVDATSQLILLHIKLNFRNALFWAIDILPVLISFKKVEGRMSEMRSLWNEYWNVIKTGIRLCEDKKWRGFQGATLIDCLTECIKALGSEEMTENVWEEIGAMIKKEIERVIRRMEGKLDIYLRVKLESIQKLIETSFTMCESFFESMESTIPLILSLIKKFNIKEYNDCGFGILASLIECAPEGRLKYKQEIWDLLDSSNVSPLMKERLVKRI